MSGFIQSDDSLKAKYAGTPTLHAFLCALGVRIPRHEVLERAIENDMSDIGYGVSGRTHWDGNA